MEFTDERKKRILIFSLAYFPMVGGAEVAIKEITDRLPHHDFDLITLRFNGRLPRTERVGNVVIHRIGFAKLDPKSEDLLAFPFYINKILFPINAFFKALRLHKKKKFDMLWPVLLYSVLPAYFFSLIHRKVPYLLTIQDGDTLHQLTGRARIKPVLPLLKLAVARATHVQAISNYLADFSKKMGARKVSVVPNGVDMSLFKRTMREPERKKRRKELGIEEDDIALITVSRLVPKNGVVDIIRSLASLPKHIKLIVVGEGPLRAQLQAAANALFVQERVIFTGNQTHAETVRFLDCADIFCRPSLSEGMGNVFLEGMAMRMPVIGTQVDGIPDFLIPQKTGWACEPKNPASIAHAVQHIINPANHKETTKILKNAYQLVEERYQWKTIAIEMNNLFTVIDDR
jgi:glycosyltransferase involved in cell wall biosynthesis